jgi:radical SAM protein with 4Fe4S-binding SPASM domain
MQDGFAFDPEEISAAVDRCGLLSMEIEFSRACNYRCPYCYNDEVGEQQSLDSDEIDEVVLQARDLGAQKIIILGGEPMIHPQILEKIRFIRDHDMAVEMFTNGTNLTPENARFMYEHDVAVVVKMNTFDRDLQDELTGHEGSYGIIHNALENLQEAGYPDDGKRLAISTVICEQNFDELPELWRWARARDIEPYFEMLTPQGRASGKDSMFVDVSRQEALFRELARIDREEFDSEWEPQPPLVGHTCLRHQFSCFVNAQGQVMPCVGVLIPIGNIRDESLETILRDSEVMDDLRNYRETIKEPCASCDRAEGCYGCRGTAYQMTGDYLAADPTCWFNDATEITKLPADVRPYLPQEEPMLLIDELVSVGERCGRVRARMPEGHPLADASGYFDETVHIEMVAQGIATINSFHQTAEQRENTTGFLMSVRDFEVIHTLRAGETAEVEVEKVTKLGEFGVVHGTVMRDGKEIASGQITVWHTEEETP